MKRLYFFLFFAVISFIGHGQNVSYTVSKIWDKAPHCAFTDLISYNGKFYCTFREGNGHVPWPSGVNGTIRVLVSNKGDKWKSLCSLSIKDKDLRDSKLSITPDGRLMLLMAACDYNHDGKVGPPLNSRLCHVSFLDNKERQFSNPKPINVDPLIRSDYDWLWRVSWHKGIGYGVIYRKKDKSKSSLFLVKTTNGLDYKLMEPFDVDGIPGECSIEFSPKDKMSIIIRRDSTSDISGLMATSEYPYNKWKWEDLKNHLGGPQIKYFKDDVYLIGTRSYLVQNNTKTAIYSYQPQKGLKYLMELPSGGDTSYPGMVINNDYLYVSYYSSHEGKTNIYFAKIPLSYLMY